MSQWHIYARAVIAQTIAELLDANERAWAKGQAAHESIGGIGRYANEDIDALRDEVAVVLALLRMRNGPSPLPGAAQQMNVNQRDKARATGPEGRGEGE